MKDLSPLEMTQAMEAMVTGRMSDGEIERFLLDLRQKGETVAEITAAVKVMRQHSLRLSKSFPSLLDTCGTGGDAKNTLNVSTLAAIVTASCGARVAKHGNRAVSSACGSADLLELLGIKIDLGPAQVEACLEKIRLRGKTQKRNRENKYLATSPRNFRNQRCRHKKIRTVTLNNETERYEGDEGVVDEGARGAAQQLSGSWGAGKTGAGERAYLLFRPAALRLTHHLPLLCLDARSVAGALHILVVARVLRSFEQVRRS